MRRRLAGVVLVLAFVSARSLAAPPSTPRLDLPDRPAGAPTGSAFAEATASLSGRERQRRVVDEILRGNVPEFARSFQPVVLDGTTPGGVAHRLRIFVSSDYLALGDDEDFLRWPLTWPSVRRVVSRLGCLPPTPRVVDAIYRQATVHLQPAPLPPGPKMRSTAYYLRHRRLIEGQRRGLGSDALIAGHKKDVVLSLRLIRRPDRIAIYGWHRQDGQPIQPLSTVHAARYADYSHGLRLVYEQALLDDRPVSLFDLLADPDLAWLVSDEGPIARARQLLDGAPTARAPVHGG